MKTMFARSILIGVSVVALLLAPTAFAATETYTAELKGASEVPPNDSAGAGTLTATLDTSTKELTYRVSFGGLSGPPTAAHFHGPAAANANAGVVVLVKELNPPIQGKATLTDAQIADLQGGKWYFNIHTEKNKGGELRGQVVKK
ncbi:MAG: CHRD domain-containing protein [Alphaproteobacteria bacterium]|nr:CHRD domain-containing protein [Alphaproteobacteria bacterium]